MEPPRQCGGGSDGSARGGDMSNGASLQHWRRPRRNGLLPPLANAFGGAGGEGGGGARGEAG